MPHGKLAPEEWEGEEGSFWRCTPPNSYHITAQTYLVTHNDCFSVLKTGHFLNDTQLCFLRWDTKKWTHDRVFDMGVQSVGTQPCIWRWDTISGHTTVYLTLGCNQWTHDRVFDVWIQPVDTRPARGCAQCTDQKRTSRHRCESSAAKNYESNIVALNCTGGFARTASRKYRRKLMEAWDCSIYSPTIGALLLEV